LGRRVALIAQQVGKEEDGSENEQPHQQQSADTATSSTTGGGTLLRRALLRGTLPATTTGGRGRSGTFALGGIGAAAFAFSGSAATAALPLDGGAAVVAVGHQDKGFLGHGFSVGGFSADNWRPSGQYPALYAAL
jgi:hypothetical protein